MEKESANTKPLLIFKRKIHLLQKVKRNQNKNGEMVERNLQVVGIANPKRVGWWKKQKNFKINSSGYTVSPKMTAIFNTIDK